MKIGLNGLITDEREAMVSVYDHGFLYGMGLFETFRTYNGEAFLLVEHLQRLSRGCSELGIQFEPDVERISGLVKDLLQANELLDGYFRYTVTAGTSILGLPGNEPYEQPTEIVYVKALPPRDENLNSEGKPLQLLRQARNTPEGLYRLKSLHYMNNILAKRELAGYPWAAGAEGLMLTDEGYIAEGVVSNIFMVRAGILYTPSLDTGCLPGVTRDLIVKFAHQSGIKFEEGLYTWDDLVSCEEIFITSSIQELVPINSLYTPDHTEIRFGSSITRCPGPMTTKLMDQYRQCIGSGI